ncbi:MAG: redoxin domain-containing protein [Bacteriovorax sp.]|nr:redoxin domain-containing protein [Bacteriovorax sp.]
MKSYFLASLLVFSLSAVAEITSKSAAPDFKLKDIQGKEHNLSDFKGKWVVLEWFNKDCPFIRKHYDSNNMQTLQAKYTAMGVVWLSVKSSAKGSQGYELGPDSVKTVERLKAHPSYVLMDDKGVVGRMYGAKTTPHMFVISPEQKVAYSGAIDDNDSSDPATTKAAKNYVAAALDSGMSGKVIAVAATKPYGCGVKY